MEGEVYLVRCTRNFIDRRKRSRRLASEAPSSSGIPRNTGFVEGDGAVFDESLPYVLVKVILKIGWSSSELFI
jgi:hypothetical protein